MNDDWRLELDFPDAKQAAQLAVQLESPALEHDLSDAFHDRVIVSRDDAQVFLYAGSKDQAGKARELILALEKQHGWNTGLELKRWHPLAEEWEDPDKPLPDGDAARAAEHEELIAAERREAEASGQPEFEVRVDLPSRRDALRFSEQLRGEGLPTVHRWRYLLIGVEDEDGAKVLAERLRAEAPSGSKVSVEGTWNAAYDERPPNPFAILGGLGG